MASSPAKAARSSKKKKGRQQPPETSPSPVNAPRDKTDSFLSLLLPAPGRSRLWLGGVVLLSLLLRVFNLMGMFPVLVDESIYMRWAEIIDHQGNWLISLLDGKPPLSYWFLAAARMLFGGDPLFQARLVSVLFGLLSTVGVFVVARRLALPRKPSSEDRDHAEKAGVLAAGFYALFPWAILYDRLAYTEAYVNFFGVAICASAILAFSEDRDDWTGEIVAGAAFGLGLFTKQTAILFGLVPAAAAFFYARGQSRRWIPRLALVYGIGAAFLAANTLLTPEAPTLESHDAVLHHTGFFAKPADLLQDPFLAARGNAPDLVEYIGIYLTWPAALVALASAAWLLRRRSFAPWLLLAGSIVPAVAEVFLLELMFPTRYPFPHFWPWLAVAAVGIAEFARTSDSSKKIATAAAAVVAAGLLFQSVRLLTDTRDTVHAWDQENFLSDIAHAGYGVSDAIEFLIDQSRAGGYILLTDPIWGPPSDAMFPYLNRRYGIQVYEAWWTQLSGTHAILPRGSAEVLHSHYERTKAGAVDFARAPRVFYVTDTNYYTPEAVLIRQPNAQRVASFPKPGGKHSVDVYRLK